MSFARLQNIIKDKSVENHFNYSSSNSNKSATPNNTCINYHKGYKSIEGLVECMISILYHASRDSPTTPPENCIQDIYHLYEINKDVPMLSYDLLDPMQVQAIYKEMINVVDDLVQSIHGNKKHLKTKLVYYLKSYDQILNSKKRKCGIQMVC
ncbi:26036_t:CDS:1 [Dentiscutata erythropus]|uniref:26036_t:CDS:1 n=1 Tax=Dentiscutata erythropus TaxID=1348616 RepID=A0A9N8VW57_9GLOM|nr:26036_t:CDS:1 [Dentiscutata erythropus]